MFPIDNVSNPCFQTTNYRTSSFRGRLNLFCYFHPLKGYLQPLDLLYNAVFKLQFKLQIEDFLLDCHFNNEKLRVTDEKGAYVATEIYNNMSQGIIQAHGS